jgi:hypothetical protein
MTSPLSEQALTSPRSTGPFAAGWPRLCGWSLSARRPLFRVAEFENESAARCLREQGLTDFGRLFALERMRSQRHDGRTVAQATMTGPDGRTQPLFVKLHWGRQRLWPRMSELRAGQALQSLPEREWRAIEQVGRLGLQVPEKLAVLREGFWWFRAAVLLRAVPPAHSLDDMLRNGSWRSLGRERQQPLLAAVVSDVRRIHAAGLVWRGVCTRHFFPQEQPDGRWSMWLIDLEGIRPGRRQTQFERDERKLLRALEISGADADCLHRVRDLLARPF